MFGVYVCVTPKAWAASQSKCNHVAHVLGQLLSDQRKYAEAARLRCDALEIRHRTLGADHPDTQQAQRNLDAALAALKAASDKKDEDG